MDLTPTECVHKVSAEEHCFECNPPASDEDRMSRYTTEQSLSINVSEENQRKLLAALINLVEKQVIIDHESDIHEEVAAAISASVTDMPESDVHSLVYWYAETSPVGSIQLKYEVRQRREEGRA